MSKRLILLVLLASTILSLGMAVFRPEETPVEARFEKVQRRDVHQVVAVTGCLTYTEEDYIYAPVSGVIKRVCVDENQRVDDGQLLFSLDSTQRDRTVATMYDRLPDQAVTAFAEWSDDGKSQAQTVLRSPYTCTIRQVMVKEGTPVMAGSPVCRVSSNQQQIVCSVTNAEAKRLKAGMWSWISSEGEPLGTASVREIGEEMVEPTTGMRLTRVVLIPDRHIDLPEGAGIDADIYLAGSDDVLSLPIDAITARNTVWWVHEGRCTEIPAQIVLCDEMNAWVELPEGLTVALGEFQEGQRVMEAAE